MGAHSNWAGGVENRSSMPVWVIWDEGEDDAHKKWFGRPLAAGRRSPKELDIDGVAAYLDNMKIANLDRRGHIKTATSDWWWLKRGAEVEIKDGYAIQTVKVTSLIGDINVVSNTDVSGWGVTWELDVDPSWGIKL